MLKIRYLENDFWKIQYFGKGQNWSRVGCTYVSSKEIDIKCLFFLKLKKKAFYDLLKFVRSAIVSFYFYLYFVYVTH
jgi:hypothetical protein